MTVAFSNGINEIFITPRGIMPEADPPSAEAAGYSAKENKLQISSILRALSLSIFFLKSSNSINIASGCFSLNLFMVE